MTLKSTTYLYFNAASLCHIFCVTSKEKGFSLRGEETLLLVYRKGIQKLFARSWEGVSSYPIKFGGKASSDSEPQLPPGAFMPTERHSGLWSPCYGCCSSISFLFKRLFFCCCIFSFPCVIAKQVVIKAVR